MDGEFLLEVYVDSVESALAAQAGGAGRVELCDNLLEGGTTPSAGMIQVVRESLHIALNVIIRPRGGDFLYTASEFEVMKRDIAVAKAAGAAGVVIGLLRSDGSVDMERTAELVALARPMTVTFHKAFDMTRDAFAALDDLIGLGVDRILTSGQEATLFEGLDLVIEMITRAKGRIIIMPGGAISERNVRTFVDRTGAQEFHVGAMVPVESSMAFRNPRCFMGAEFRPPEYSRQVVDSAQVRRLRELARG